MKIKAILFDMDGVLIDAKEWHYEALNRALKLFGMHISRFDHLTNFDGLPTLRKLEILTIERGLPKELHEFINEMKQKFTMEIVHARCKPMFIHEYALSNLKNRGYKLAVCSNSVRNTVETMMQRSALSGYLDFVISNEDVSKCKPDPEMYIRSMEHFSVKPTECLIVEDNENGIKAAKSSGAHLLAIKEVKEVNINTIMNRIYEIESGVSA